MGHLMRCAALARVAQARGHSVTALLNADEAAAVAWREASRTKRIESWDALKRPLRLDGLVIDTRGDKRALLAECRRRKLPSLVLDDRSALNEADLTICPALHEAPVETPTFRAGPKYSILSPDHQRPIQDAGPQDRFLITLGGSDPHRFTETIAPVALRVLRSGGAAEAGLRRFDLVLGPAFRDPQAELARKLEASGWQVHRALPPAGMARLMKETRLALCGFGTALTELAMHRVPSLTVTHHRSDKAFALALEARGMARWLCYAGSPSSPALADRIDQALRDHAWRSESASRAFEAIDRGRGTDRILEEVESLCLRESPLPLLRGGSDPGPALGG